MTKTWNLTLTPQNGPVTTYEGVPTEATGRALFELLYGSGTLELPRRRQSDESGLSLAA